jgi:hypothetical protein
MTTDHVTSWLKQELAKELSSKPKGKGKQGCRPANYSSDDSDGDFGDVQSATTTTVSTELVKYLPFLTQLKECVAMNFGFHCAQNNGKAGHWCYCPCGKHMDSWRERFNLKLTYQDAHAQCKAGTKFTPNALMDHLRTGAGDTRIYHSIVGKYLRSLYSNFFPELHLDHYALYKRNSKDFRASVAALQKCINDLQQLEELLEEPIFPNQLSTFSSMSSCALEITAQHGCPKG